MSDKITAISAAIQVQKIGGTAPLPKEIIGANQPAFDTVLKAQQTPSSPIRFSNHAQKRITARQINFSEAETQRLEQAVEKAANKGARESLILMDDLALVVSIQNKVVITAVDANNRKENVFTNIDSVVLT